MRYYWISVLSILALVPLGRLQTPLRWNDMDMKHTLGFCPVELGEPRPTCPPALHSTSPLHSRPTTGMRMPRLMRTTRSVIRSDAGRCDLPVVQVNDGDTGPNNPGVEANVDIQYAKAMTIRPHTSSAAPAADPERPADDQHIVSRRREKLHAGLCNIPVVLSGDDDIGEDCIGGSGGIQFMPSFPTSFSSAAASRTTFNPRATSSKSCPPPSLTSATNIKASTRVASGPGRSIPDIAAQAMKIPILVEGTGYSDRTSFPSPSAYLPELTSNAQIVAGNIFFSLINDCLLSQGKAPLA
ncbi:hypothetical protein BJY52DRAFT_1215633 [Lactarius psammicola]|nr:hypothetical protein BJY52DRAFT_1215633 [Lactarius psammicola]